MFTRLSQSLFEASIRSAYTRRFREKGAQAEGVFWASRLSQHARFEQVLQDMKSEQGTARFSLADVGCGYGALFDYIRRTEAWREIEYSGVDINQDMIGYCKREHAQHKHRFTTGRGPQRPVDFAVFVGTFNLCHTDDYSLWEGYILRQLKLSWGQVKTGMVLNITSQPEARINNNIFYVQPDAFADKLAAAFGPTAACPTRFVDQDVTYVIAKETR